MGLLDLIIVILVLMWLGGAYIVPFGGSAIHLLIVVVLVVVLVRILRGERL